MGDYEYGDDSDESYENRGDGHFDYTEDTPDTSDGVNGGSEYVSEYAGIHRAMFLLIIVLIIGIVMLGLFIAIRPAPVLVPTMKPPWLV